MLAYLDSHVHIYPSFDLGLLLDAVWKHQRRHGLLCEDSEPTLCLVERSEQHWFQSTNEGKTTLPAGWTLRQLESGRSFRLESRQFGVTFIAGRQIVTTERLEILALGMDLAIPDGLEAVDVVVLVEEGGAIPVLAWAPGKWEFARSKVVGRLLQHFGPSRLAMGDTSLRPSMWDGGKWMRYGRKAGFAMLPGSDPLPMTSEQVRAGSYATLLTVDPAAPAASLHSWFHASGRAQTVIPFRSSLGTVLGRMWAHSRNKRHG